MVAESVIGHRFILDANCLIDCGERFYPDDVFSGLWRQIREALTDGSVLTCKTVIEEIKRGDEAAWRTAVCRITVAHVIDEADSDIQVEFARLARLTGLPSGLSDVDRLVLACGGARSLGIVTRDAEIVKACARPDIQPQSFGPAEFFRAMGWVFP